MNDSITIFTDGSSRGNPGPGGWGSILVYPNNEKIAEFSVEELGGKEEHTTNNRMELVAVIEALQKVKDMRDGGRIKIYSDSRYVINGSTKWLVGWQKKNWINSQKELVLNRDLWETIAEFVLDDEVFSKNIQWNYIGGHVGIPGNERCDQIATSFADGEKVSLYKGPLGGYKINIANVTGSAVKKSDKSAAKSRSQAKAYSYLSMVNGVIERHTTWVECEARVKGKSGAKYKKALTVEEEARIISEWNSQGKA